VAPVTAEEERDIVEVIERGLKQRNAAC
jgi:hypothetical protein